MTEQFRRALMLVVFALVSAGSTLGTQEWGVHLEPEGVPSGGAAPAGSEMFFIGEPVKFTLELFPLNEGGPGAALPNHWWENTTLRVRDRSTGEEIELTAVGETIDVTTRVRKFRNQAADTPLVMNGGEKDRVVLTLDLPVGDYDVTLYLRAGDVVLSSHQRLIAVREGHESLEVRRTWLHHKSWAKPFEEAKPYLLELALMMKPDQWGYWKRLGDGSMGKVPVEETLDYYARAERAIRERMKSAGASEYLERSLKQVTLFERVLPVLKQHEGRLRLVVRGNPIGAQQEYYWFDLERKEKLSRVDLDAPRFEGFARSTAR